MSIILKRASRLDDAIRVESLRGVTFTNENGGHRFVISCFRDEEHQSLTGTISVRFMRSDGVTILLGHGAESGRENFAGIDEEGNAFVLLHQDCYNVPGRFQIAVFNTAGGSTTCIYAAVGMVQRTQGEALIDSGDIIGSVDDLIAEIQRVEQTIPADYSTLSSTVSQHTSKIDAYLSGTHPARPIKFNDSSYTYNGSNSAVSVSGLPAGYVFNGFEQIQQTGTNTHFALLRGIADGIPVIATGGKLKVSFYVELQDGVESVATRLIYLTSRSLVNASASHMDINNAVLVPGWNVLEFTSVADVDTSYQLYRFLYIRCASLENIRSIKNVYAFYGNALVPDVYSKSQVDVKFADVATELDNVYTKSQTDIKIADGMAEVENKIPVLHIGQNKFYNIDVVPGYLQSATKISANATYETTDFIDVSGYVNNVCISPRVRQWAEYLADKTPNTSADDSGYHNPSAYIRNAVLTPHTDTKYIRFTYYVADKDVLMLEDATACSSEYQAPYLTFDEEIDLNNTQRGTAREIAEEVVAESATPQHVDRLWGKKWAVCGDSFSAGDFSRSPVSGNTITEGRYAGQYKVYGFLIGNRCNMDIQHLAVNGATIATPADGTFFNAFSDETNTGKTIGKFTVHNYTEIDSDVDFITLYYGINDAHHAGIGDDDEDTQGAIPLGTLADTTNATFYGAWNVVMQYLKTHYPFAHIGIIISNGTDAATYPQAEREIARKWGVPFLDLNGDDRTPAMLRPVNSNLSADLVTALLENQAVRPYTETIDGTVYKMNRHPNANAHLFESWLIEEFLRSM